MAEINNLESKRTNTKIRKAIPMVVAAPPPFFEIAKQWKQFQYLLIREEADKMWHVMQWDRTTPFKCRYWSHMYLQE